jgi:hypothetical protein
MYLNAWKDLKVNDNNYKMLGTDLKKEGSSNQVF